MAHTTQNPPLWMLLVVAGGLRTSPCLGLNIHQKPIWSSTMSALLPDSLIGSLRLIYIPVLLLPEVVAVVYITQQKEAMVMVAMVVHG